MAMLCLPTDVKACREELIGEAKRCQDRAPKMTKSILTRYNSIQSEILLQNGPRAGLIADRHKLWRNMMMPCNTRILHASSLRKEEKRACLVRTDARLRERFAGLIYDQAPSYGVDG